MNWIMHIVLIVLYKKFLAATTGNHVPTSTSFVIRATFYNINEQKQSSQASQSDDY